mmetsp:Transcript_10421/g.22062  ORF Transcript_10421/g.22062 Transcript_10421/m.22062 type:complete len:315 (+) Transcript_10421:477-1421(+)
MIDDHILPAGVEDSAVVVVPCRPGCYRYGDRSLVIERYHERRQIILRQLLEAHHAEAGTAHFRRFLALQKNGTGLIAIPIGGCVGPVVFSIASFLHHIVHGELGGRTRATALAATLLGVRGARHDLLHRELPVFLVELGVGPQHRGGGEGPATPARTLVLDLRGGAQLPFPSELRWQVRKAELLGASVDELRGRPPDSVPLRPGETVVAPELCQLLIRLVGKLVHGCCPEATGLAVVRFHPRKALFKQGLACLVVLSSRLVVTAVHFYELLEGCHSIPPLPASAKAGLGTTCARGSHEEREFVIRCRDSSCQGP